MNYSQQGIGQIAAALVKARKNFAPIVRSKTVEVRTQNRGTYAFQYAPMDEIQAATEPALNEQGITILQNVGKSGVTTVLLHASGEWIESDPVALQENLYGTQFGADVTFKKRYQYSSLLNIAIEDDDTDVRNNPDEAPSGRITPNSGVMDMVPTPEQEAMRQLAAQVDNQFMQRNPIGGLALHDKSGYTGELYIAFWSLLDSKTRTAIKKMQAARQVSEAQQNVGNVGKQEI